jgi:hypothetical protein
MMIKGGGGLSELSAFTFGCVGSGMKSNLENDRNFKDLDL